jgi:hypothetical protein
LSYVVVPDEQWDQLLAATAPYRRDPENNDLRVGMAYAVKQPGGKIPDLVNFRPHCSPEHEDTDVSLKYV